MNAIRTMAAFYPRYYLQKYPDVAQAYNDSEIGAARHYADFGINELRCPSPFFDPGIYRQYPDLSSFTGAELLNHWIDFGINERRRGSEHFDLGFYFDNYEDIRRIIGPTADALLEHWIEFGNVEGRFTAAGNRILRIGIREEDGVTNLVAATAGPASNDPDLFMPFNTTGGKIGFGVGLVIGTIIGAAEGDPRDGAIAGATLGTLIGHGLDRTLTHIANDITGPAWHDLEQGPIGNVLGKLSNSIGGRLVGGNLGIQIGPIRL